MTQPGTIQVTDELERRIRKPIDALRCIVSCVWIFVLAVALGIAVFSMVDLVRAKQVRHLAKPWWALLASPRRCWATPRC